MWTCAICKTQHTKTPLCFGADAPWRDLVPVEEFKARVALSQDQCVVDGKHFFVRGHLELPIVDHDEEFAWSVWCSLSAESFRRMSERWEDPARDGDGYFGWLCTAIPVYPNTLHLKTNVLVREVGLVPLIQIQPCDHPLFTDQQAGLSMERVHEIAHTLGCVAGDG